MRGKELDRRTFVIASTGVIASSTLLSAGPAWAGGPPAPKNGKFFVRDYGAVPSTSQDMGPAIRAALSAATAWVASANGNRTARVIFEPGVYRVGAMTTGNWYAVEISDARRLSLEGNGAELLITDPHVGILAISRSEDIRVRDFVFDYELPPFTQGTIATIDLTAGTFDLALMNGYPSFSDTELFPGTGYGTLREPVTGRVKRGGQVSFTYSALTAIGGGLWRVTVAPEHRGGMGSLAVGDGYVAGHRGSRGGGITLYRSEDIELSSVTVHAAPGAAFMAAECEKTVVKDCAVRIKPSSTRWISSNADAFHNPGGRVGPQLLRNHFEGMHDDGINIYSKARIVTAVSAAGTELTLSGSPMHVAVGDRLQSYYAATGLVRGTAVVTAVAGDELSGAEVTVQLDALIPGTAVGDEVYNLDYAASGFVVSENVITENRGGGMVIRASNGVVSKNQIIDVAHWGMWVGNASGYQEGPVGLHDVSFVSNAIVRPCIDRTLVGWPSFSAAMMVQNFNAVYEAGVSQASHDISIKKMYIEDPPRFGIYLGAVQNVEVSDTVMVETSGNPRAAAPTAMLGVDNATGVSVKALAVTQVQPARDEVWLGSSVTGYTRT